MDWFTKPLSALRSAGGMFLQERSTADRESLKDDLQQAIAAWNQAATVGRQSLREVQAALEQAQHSARTSAAAAAAQLREMESKMRSLELSKNAAEQGLARSEATRKEAYTATQQVGIRLHCSRGRGSIRGESSLQVWRQMRA